MEIKSVAAISLVFLFRAISFKTSFSRSVKCILSEASFLGLFDHRVRGNLFCVMGTNRGTRARFAAIVSRS